MNNHPVISILFNKYKNLYDSLISNTHIILLPEAKTLLNTNIDIEFIKKHIFRKSHLKNIYINLHDQCIEIDSKYISTSYGFEENRKCEIIKEEINSNDKFSRVIFINLPLEEHEKNLSVNYTTINENDKNILDYKNDLTLFFNKNSKCKEFIDSEILQFAYSYIIVTGYENFIGRKILNIVNDTLKLQNSDNEKNFSNDIKIPLIKYIYSYLHRVIWKHLIKNYEKIECKIQKKMNTLRNNIITFLKKSNLENFSLFHIETISFHLKQIEKFSNPIDKIYILDNISDIICEIIFKTNINLKEKNSEIYDVNSDSLIAILAAAIAYSQIKYIISHSIHLHMYIDNLSTSEKIDKLSFIFTIFHSSIIYLCDMNDL
ncbi:conserved Plasmodium protein, unknown function [Plasmodium gallinaceum]|uniref:VPS9 domain-containing protein n=1 Tax=Plasmodium gallinaceum TaxID=5849 RepID=A0A1J1GVF7_PLAGA|nr:conserved Plasmodium protein, unknown function [Plasmodium gallinaceum]CRG96442.1 conserved Plasmodium protein, unknown function [Plasmodium gallinaceum]